MDCCFFLILHCGIFEAFFYTIARGFEFSGFHHAPREKPHRCKRWLVLNGDTLSSSLCSTMFSFFACFLRTYDFDLGEKQDSCLTGYLQPSDTTLFRQSSIVIDSAIGAGSGISCLCWGWSVTPLRQPV